MSSERKDTIYIDIDDEITSVIEKVHSSPQKIVALVLPKRAAILQSIVNMKLLKRSSEEAKKHLVLITSEAALMPLAGAVGLYVAKTLLSKPAVPAPPPDPDAISAEQAEKANKPDAPLDSAKPVSELAGLPLANQEETIEVDNDDPGAAVPAKKLKKEKVPKGLKIPNFNKFRTKLLLAGLAVVLLLAGLYMANFVLPAADVFIQGETENVNASVKFISSPNAEEFDAQQAIIPAVTKELKKSESQKAATTGQKNTGQKATGTARLINCNQADKLSDKVRTVPAGTAISSGGLTFIMAETVDVEPSSYIGNMCLENKKSDAVDVTAQNPGDNYNLSARDYTVAGFATITAEGSDMSGGTSQIVKVVSQQDIDDLRQKITDGFNAGAKEELKQQLLAESLIALEDTFQVGQPVAVSSPNVNTEAGEVTVNVTMNFTMQGIKQTDATALIDRAIAGEIDPERQKVSNYGLADAVFQVGERKPNNDVSYTLQTVVVAGPEIDENALKQEIAGKKEGEAENIIKDRPGVKEVRVQYSPFWVTKAPDKPAKISVTIENTTIAPTDNETGND